MSYSTNSK